MLSGSHRRAKLSFSSMNIEASRSFTPPLWLGCWSIAGLTQHVCRWNQFSHLGEEREP